MKITLITEAEAAGCAVLCCARGLSRLTVAVRRALLWKGGALRHVVHCQRPRGTGVPKWRRGLCVCVRACVCVCVCVRARARAWPAPLLPSGKALPARRRTRSLRPQAVIVHHDPSAHRHDDPGSDHPRAVGPQRAARERRRRHRDLSALRLADAGGHSQRIPRLLVRVVPPQARRDHTRN